MAVKSSKSLKDLSHFLISKILSQGWGGTRGFVALFWNFSDCGTATAAVLPPFLLLSSLQEPVWMNQWGAGSAAQGCLQTAVSPYFILFSRWISTRSCYFQGEKLLLSRVQGVIFKVPWRIPLILGPAKKWISKCMGYDKMDKWNQWIKGQTLQSNKTMVRRRSSIYRW